MKVDLDNIVFSLQKSGGNSVVWQQHLKRLLVDHNFDCKILEYDNAKQNLFRKQLDIDANIITELSSNFLKFKRYLDLQGSDSEKQIFHSSFYRIKNAKNTINITTVHDFTYEYFVKGIRQKVHSWQKNKSINLANGLICISNSTKRDLLRFIPNTDESKIRVIYNGVDDIFRPVEQNFSFKLPFEPYSYALYVGDRKSVHKNFGLVIDVCEIAKIPLLMIGGGALTEIEINLLNSKLSLENYNIVLGASSEDLNYYYNHAKCLLYLSNYEGFGIPVVEAQRAGCPVLAINTSSIPEVIGNPYLMSDKDNKTIIANKIKELSIGGSLRKESIEIGFQKSKIFSWQKTYEQTAEYYNELYEKPI